MCQLYFFIAAKLSELGDAVPQTPWDFSLCGLNGRGMPGWQASPTCRYKPPDGARVASPQSPILRWSPASISAPSPATMGLTQKSGFARTSGFENYKVSGFANYSRPVLLAPQQEFSCSATEVNAARLLRGCANGNCSEGISENSPAFQRRETRDAGRVPKSRLNDRATISRPFGTCAFAHHARR